MLSRNLKLVIEYDGTDFAGWQVQPGQRTVQGVLEGAFADLTGAPVSVTGSGRTDAGVHALGQVASVELGETGLELPADRVRAAVNARLPGDVRLLSVDVAPADFHARFSATSRSYIYLIGATESPIWRRNRWFVPFPMDEKAMRGAAEAISGEHDFSSFALTGSEPDHHRCRVTAISLECDSRFGGTTVFSITANRFLRGMVRSIVGTLVEVGRGKVTPEGFAEILEARDRGAAGQTAPPWGLYLKEVRYD